MKRYTEKYIPIWKEPLWVTCPECQGAAHITYTQEGAIVQCSCCSFHSSQEDLQYFEAITVLNCPNCGTPIRHSQKGLKEKSKLIKVSYTFYKKGTRHWTQFVRNNRLLRALSKEELMDIPLEKPECFLVEYSNADFGKEVLTHFLQRYLQTNPPHSLYIDMGDTLYSAQELYNLLLKYPAWDWNKDR